MDVDRIAGLISGIVSAILVTTIEVATLLEIGSGEVIFWICTIFVAIFPIIIGLCTGYRPLWKVILRPVVFGFLAMIISILIAWFFSDERNWILAIILAFLCSIPSAKIIFVIVDFMD